MPYIIIFFVCVEWTSDVSNLKRSQDVINDLEKFDVLGL